MSESERETKRDKAGEIRDRNERVSHFIKNPAELKKQLYGVV